MSNHTHVVLHVNKEKAEAWSDKEVLTRWHKLHRGLRLTKRFLNEDERHTITAAERQTIAEIVERYRRRLFDISWFMRLLNERIARQANKEDDCTGRFWEGRFKSQAILDEAALAACMAYVDLNPTRAGIAGSPETSDHTSVQYRVSAAKVNKQPKPLFPFLEDSKDGAQQNLPFRFKDYLLLLKDTVRVLHSVTKGSSCITPSPILVQANISPPSWETLVTGVEKYFSNSISLRIASRRLRYKMLRHRFSIASRSV